MPKEIAPTQRVYRAEPHALFGACLTALAQMRARVERHDAAAGAIVAVLGGGFLAPASQLTLQIAPIGPGQSQLNVSALPLRRGGDRRALPVLLATIDGLLAAG